MVKLFREIMFGIRELNVSIELWGIAFSLIGLACSLFFMRTQMRYRIEFCALFALNLITVGGDVLVNICRGKHGAWAWFGTHAGSFASFCGGFLLIAVLTSYLCKRIAAKDKTNTVRWNKFVSYAAIVMCVLAAFGVFYYIDGDNIYHRNDLYWLSTAFVIFVSLFNAMLVINRRSCFDAFGLFCMLFYAMSPTVSAIAQITADGINYQAIISTIGLVLIFFEMQAYSATEYAKRSEELAQSEVELSERRIAAMVSQIQPHFIFNTLDTIYGLCDDDVDLAKEAISSFSRYLRMNLVSLRRAEPIPILTEIQHVKTYLELERLSDKDRLSYSIDIEATGFLVPALCVQTIVENAVKHGLGKRKEGGNVWVSTRELSDEYVVRVLDDGVGFDASMLKTTDDDIHVGIANTKMRLAEMCGGSLDIASVPSKGTTVIIRIPKEETA